MRERSRHIEIPATETEIRQAVEGWWTYLDQKMKVHPHLREGTHIVYYKDLPVVEQPTVNLSLVGTIPELAGLRKLANAKEPHMFVEGARNPNIIVEFDELYFQKFGRFFGMERDKKLLGSWVQRGIVPDRFLLYVYATNDMDVYGRIYQNATERELVFFTSKDDKINAYDLKSGWRSINPFRGGRTLGFERKRALTARPVNQSQIEIVQESFRDAMSQLSLIK